MSSSSGFSEPLRLPSHLFSSYRQYKAVQGTVVQWLVASSDCPGLEPPQDDAENPSPIPINHLIRMAHNISDFTTITVPAYIIADLELVLARRRQCAYWYESNAMSEGHLTSTNKHCYFIEALQKIHDILIAAPQRVPVRHATTVDMQPSVSDDAGEEDALGEAISEVHIHAENDDSNKTPEAGRAGDQARPIEIEGHASEDEKVFLCYCVLDDLNNYRDYIKELWTEYKNGLTPLFLAAVITENAMDLARRVIEDFHDATKKDDTSFSSYFVPFFRNMLGAVWWPSCRDRQALYGFESRGWNSASEAVIANWGFLNAWLALSHWQSDPSMQQDYSQQAPETWDFPFPPTYKSEPSNVDTPSGTKLICEYIYLSHARLSPHLDCFRWTDSISEAFEELRDDSDISLYTVFAAQVLLDIHEIILERGLVKGTAEALGTLIHVKSSRDLTQEITARMMPQDARNRVHVANVLKCRDDEFAAIDKAFREKSQRYVFARNPIQAGLASFHLLQHWNKWGTAVADMFGYPYKALHIYNAAIQERALDMSWPDLDHLIAVHKPGFLFVGGFPRSCNQYAEKMRLAGGASFTKDSVDNNRSRRLYLHVSKLFQVLVVRHSYCAAEPGCAVRRATARPWGNEKVRSWDEALGHG